MVNQKLIALKLDLDLVGQVDSYCVKRHVKRNRMLNDIIRGVLADAQLLSLFV